MNDEINEDNDFFSNDNGELKPVTINEEDRDKYYIFSCQIKNIIYKNIYKLYVPFIILFHFLFFLMTNYPIKMYHIWINIFIIFIIILSVWK